MVNTVAIEQFVDQWRHEGHDPEALVHVAKAGPQSWDVTTREPKLNGRYRWTPGADLVVEDKSIQAIVFPASRRYCNDCWKAVPMPKPRVQNPCSYGPCEVCGATKYGLLLERAK